MLMQEAYHKDLAPSDKKKEKRKIRYCDLEGQEGVICDYEKHSTSIVSEKVIIPSSSQYLNLKTLNLSGVKAKDKGIDEMDITEPNDDTNINDKDFFLDKNIDQDNIDLLFKRAINVLK
ncbi:14737_t:CDS:2, partial [Funneliformis geosporum]